MNANKVKAALEAILFASGDPISATKLAQALEVEPDLLVLILQNLQDELEERESGLCIVKLGDKYQMCTRTEFSESVRKVLEMRRNVPLSQAAFEVLAVIAYNQPVTKSFVEQVRGVDCSGVIASLTQKGLIEERGRLDLPGKPLIYGTTPAFLRCFCIESLSDLPALPESEMAEPTNVAEETEDESEPEVSATESDSENSDESRLGE